MNNGNDLFTKILQSIVGFLITMLVAFIAWQTTKWSNSIDSLSQSVTELNTKMQVVVTQFSTSNENNNRILGDHELRIRTLEKIK